MISRVRGVHRSIWINRIVLGCITKHKPHWENSSVPLAFELILNGVEQVPTFSTLLKEWHTTIPADKSVSAFDLEMINIEHLLAFDRCILWY